MRAGKKADTGRRAGLTREVIGRSALAIVDAEGLDALSMRRLGVALEVSPMALYNHVRDRSDLDQLVVDAIVGTHPWSDPPGDGLEVLVGVGTHLRTMYLAHANAIRLIQTVASSESAGLRVVETTLDTLGRLGHSVERSRTIWVGLVSLVTGLVTFESQQHFANPTVAADLPPGFDRLRDAVTAGPIDHERCFDDSIAAYLRGIPSPR